MARASRIITPTTAAIVDCKNPRFWNAQQQEDANTVFMDMTIQFNGISGEMGDYVTFDRNATNAEKQAAVRNRVNALIGSVEVGVSLNNANIQIIGLPI